jgi:hypothetical protein
LSAPTSIRHSSKKEFFAFIPEMSYDLVELEAGARQLLKKRGLTGLFIPEVLLFNFFIKRFYKTTIKK